MLRKLLLLLLALSLLLCAGCSAVPNGEETLPSESPEVPESTYSIPEELLGVWVSASAGERNMVETITFFADGTMTVELDYEGSDYGILYGSFYMAGNSIVCHISEGADPYDVTYEYRIDGRELYLTDDDGIAQYLRNS